jgi:hypothetical protein
MSASDLRGEENRSVQAGKPWSYIEKLVIIICIGF